MKINSKFKINDYAKSMFYFEKLNDSWIKLCKKYLKYIFKNKIKNAVVVDYAFGNGNWSVAFSKLGAKEIISVDDSIHNVQKFKRYLKKNKISNIKVLKGNILDINLKNQVDIFWVYGIFHHIQNTKKLITNLKKYWKNENSVALIYAYNKYSLRQLVVDFSRKFLRYKNFLEFKKNSYQFNHYARMRARDDMVVNFIKWYSKDELNKSLIKMKLYGFRFIKSFEKFLGRKNFEFDPNQLLVSKRKISKLNIKKENYDFDLKIIECLLKLIQKKIKNKKELNQISISLLNSHFNGNYSNYSDNLSRISLFLFYIIKSKKLNGSTKFLKDILNVLNLIHQNKKINSQHLKFIKRSVLLSNLYQKKIRI